MGSSGRTSNRDNGFVERERRAYGGCTPWPPSSRPTETGHGRCAAAGHVKKGGGIACDCHGSNGGRARCPHRAARVMRVCNGECGEGHGAGARDAKQRTAPMARRREPGGPAADIALNRTEARAWSTVTGAGHGRGTRRGVCNGRRVAMRFIKKGQESVWFFRLIPQNRGINYPRNIKSIENKGVSCILALGK